MGSLGKATRYTLAPFVTSPYDDEVAVKEEKPECIWNIGFNPSLDD
jgi:hypothetical protein